MEIERNARKEKSYIPAARPVKPHDPTVNEYKDRPVLPTPLQVVGVKTPEGHTVPHTTITKTTAQSVLVPPQPKAVIPAIGDTVTGNRNGPTRDPIRGVKVKINPSFCQPPQGTEVIGIIRAEDAAGQVTGGFKGEVIGREDHRQIIYLFLKPLKSVRSST